MAALLLRRALQRSARRAPPSAPPLARRLATAPPPSTACVAPEGTHHLLHAGGPQLYEPCFKAVLAFHSPPGLAPAQLADSSL